MRLTVHVAEAKKEKMEVKTKNGLVNKMVIKNTLSFHNVDKSNVPEILEQIKAEGHGIPMKHYLSEETAPGRAFILKKKKK